MWQNRCDCGVSVYHQRNAADVGLFHSTADKVTNRILEWLDDHGL